MSDLGIPFLQHRYHAKFNKHDSIHVKIVITILTTVLTLLSHACMHAQTFRHHQLSVIKWVCECRGTVIWYTGSGERLIRGQG